MFLTISVIPHVTAQESAIQWGWGSGVNHEFLKPSSAREIEVELKPLNRPPLIKWDEFKVSVPKQIPPVSLNKNERNAENRIPKFYYSIRSKTNGKAIAVSSGGKQDGANVMLWDSLFADGQIWELRPVGVYFQIAALHSGKLLTVRNSSLEENANVEQHSEVKGNEAQLWKLETDADGYVRFSAKHSSKYLSCRRRGELNRINIEQKGRLDTDDQKWLLSITKVEWTLGK